MERVLLIGAGNIGSRHLQGLARIEEAIEIVVIDPSSNSLSLAKERFYEVEGAAKHRIYLYENLESLESSELAFGLVIIATSSLIRLEALKTVLKSTQCSNVLLEKFLFTSLSEYSQAEKVLGNIPTWVNCPLRLYPIFRRIKEDIRDILNVEFEYIGGEWIGLGCNSIHYIDLFSFLIDKNLSEVSTSSLVREVRPSKREGYVEFCGTLKAEYGETAKLSVTSIMDSDEVSTIRITADNQCFIIDELSGKASKKCVDGSAEDISYQVPYQSDLTGVVAMDILKNGTCSLPNFEQSSFHHKLLLNSLLAHYNSISKKAVKILPIT